MKKYFKLLFLLSTVIIALAGCQKIYDKVDNLPAYAAGGTAVVLSSSTTSIAPTPSDSNKVVATFSWTNPNYANDSTTSKFILEVDSSGRNFSKEIVSTVTGKLNISFTGLQLNNMLAAFGFTPGQTFSFDIRVKSSYGNNNNLLLSNIITVKITSYLVPITLTPTSTSAITLLVANATSPAIGFNWNTSGYGTNTINYALQFDVVGGNFASPQVIKYGSSVTSSILVTDLNTACIAAGVLGGSTKNVEFRVVSYLGTTYSTPLVYSNAVTLSVTTFTPIPPVLFIIGDATTLGWNNNSGLAPSQQFTRLDAVSYGIITTLKAGGGYVFLPEDQGLWTHKYGGTSATGGALLSDNAVPGSNTPAPATTGLYQIIVNFQTGTYTVTPYTSTIPSQLFIIGGATALGWNNNSGLSPTQQFTQIDASSFALITTLTAGTNGYVFLPVDNGDWSHKFGGTTDGTAAGGGTLLADGAVPGSNTPAPATTGTYLIVVNFITNKYTVTPYTGTAIPNVLFIIGDATPLGWNNNSGLAPTQQFTQISNAEFQLTVPLTAGATKGFVFIPEDQGLWSHKFGGTTDGTAGSGTLLVDNAVPGSNTPAPSVTGNYLIDINFITMKYTLTKQ